MSSNKLMDFRLAYLSFIARAWSKNDMFKENWIQEYKINKNDNNSIFDLGRILDAEISSRFSDPTDSSQENNDDSEAYFCDGWNIQFQLKVWGDSEKKTQWNNLTHGWQGLNDVFCIKIPMWEEEPDALTQLQALTHYYERFPTIFGHSKYTPGVDHIGLSSNLGMGCEFLEFGAVIMDIIALAWSDPNFTKAVILPDKIKIDDIYGGVGDNKNDSDSVSGNKYKAYDISPLLSQYFGFNNPWNFNIIIKQVPKVEIKEKDNPFKVKSKKFWEGEFYIWIPVDLAYDAPPPENPLIAVLEYNNNEYYIINFSYNDNSTLKGMKDGIEKRYEINNIFLCEEVDGNEQRQNIENLKDNNKIDIVEYVKKYLNIQLDKIITHYLESESEAKNGTLNLTGIKFFLRPPYTWQEGKNVVTLVKREQLNKPIELEVDITLPDKKGEKKITIVFKNYQFPKNIVRLNYPEKPAEEAKVTLLHALNAYNCTGPHYPFTCGT